MSDTSAPATKRVVSVSLGTSKRDKKNEVTLLDQKFVLERIGTDGDLQRYAALFSELDGKVDALGVGGADIWVVVEDHRYAFRQIQQLIAGAKRTPVVDGSGLKHTLERETIRTLQREGTVNFRGTRTLMVSAVDRFGMAQALVEAGAEVVFGDIMFAIGLPIPLRRYAQVRSIGHLVLPVITKLPFKWFYPTGEKQEQRHPKHRRFFEEASVICGDWHFIRRYAPERLEGKTIITNTLRKADLEMLREMGVAKAITTTPEIGGETFATNVMEGVVVAYLGKRPEEIGEQDYLETLGKLNWHPAVHDIS